MILDHRGRPIRLEELREEPQTSRLGHLHREYGDHPSRGLTPAKLAGILLEAEQGHLQSQARLAEDMEEKDSHLAAELLKRKHAILGVEWTLEAPVDASHLEKKETERIKEIISALPLEELLFNSADAVLKGYSCQELAWSREGAAWVPSTIEHRPADWFLTTLEDRNTLRLRTVDGRGESLRDFGWIVHEHRAKSGYLVRGGLVRVLAWPYLFRNYSLRDFAEFLEIYGLPMRLGKYPQGASKEEKDTLLRAVVGIGHAAAGIIPQEMAIEFEEAAQGAADPFLAMISHAEKSVSKAVLGATLTSQTDDGGAYALGAVHNEVRHDILSSDLRQIARTLTRDLVRPIALLNTRLERFPQFVFLEDQPEDLKLYGELLPHLLNTDLRISKQWAHKTFRVPEALDEDDVLQKKEQPALWARAQLGPEMVSARTAATEPESDIVDEQVQRLRQDGGQAIAEWVEKVRAALDEAASLEEFRDHLLELSSELDTKQLAEVMGHALTAAEMAGRFQVLENSK